MGLEARPKKRTQLWGGSGVARDGKLAPWGAKGMAVWRHALEIKGWTDLTCIDAPFEESSVDVESKKPIRYGECSEHLRTQHFDGQTRLV